jgi:hypothetical protein
MTQTNFNLRHTAFAALLIIFSGLMTARADDEIPAKDQNVLMFTGEIRNFVDLATELHGNTPETTDSSKQDPKLEELYRTASRIARIYFQELNTENHSKLDAFLGETLNKNQDLKNYFSIIGNGFMEQANNLIHKQEHRNQVIQIWSTVGGAVVGLGVGGTYLYITTNWQKSLSLKPVLIAATAFVGLTAVGYGVGLATTYVLPINSSVQNARDFALRYPHGEDFIHAVEGNSTGDLALGLSELED